MKLKIRQSYHGTGGIDGYRFKLYNEVGTKLGELECLPTNFSSGDTLYLSGELYIVVDKYDSTLKHEERSEVIYYELEPYKFEATYDLKYESFKIKS